MGTHERNTRGLASLLKTVNEREQIEAEQADDAVSVPVDEPGTVEIETAGEFTRVTEDKPEPDTSDDGPTGPIGEVPVGLFAVTGRGALLLVTGNNSDGTRVQVQAQKKGGDWGRASKEADYQVRVPRQVSEDCKRAAMDSLGKRTRKIVDAALRVDRVTTTEDMPGGVMYNSAPEAVGDEDAALRVDAEAAAPTADEAPVEHGPIPHPGDFAGLPPGVVYAAPKEHDQDSELQELRAEIASMQAEIEKHHQENVRHIDTLQRRGKRQRDETHQNFRNTQAQFDAMEAEIKMLREQVEFQRGAGILAEISRLVKQAGY